MPTVFQVLKSSDVPIWYKLYQFSYIPGSTVSELFDFCQFKQEGETLYLTVVLVYSRVILHYVLFLLLFQPAVVLIIELTQLLSSFLPAIVGFYKWPRCFLMKTKRAG